MRFQSEILSVRRSKLLCSTVLGASMVLTGGVQAQDSASSDDEMFQLEEIIVHGQRKAQSILDVPVSASIFSAEKMETENITDAKGYLLQTPNVTFQQGGRNGQREIVIAIRGISDVKGGEKVNQTSAFATYFDDFGLSTLATGQPNPSVYDAQTVEVLRGPQGVFFGRNAEGGAINIRSNKPGEEFYGRIDVGYGSFGEYRASGVVNLPVSETLFARLSVDSSLSDGPFKNAHASGGNTGTEYVMARGQLRWVPTDRTTVDLSVNYTLDYNDHQQKLPTCLNTYFGGDPFDQTTGQGIGCYDFRGEFSSRVKEGEVTLPDGVTLSNIKENRDFIVHDADEFSDARTGIYIGKIEHDFSDSLSLVSITGYVESQMDQQLDLDGSGRDFLVRHGRFDSEGWSQEIRLSNTGETLDWMIGGIYYDESNFAYNDIEIRDFLGPWMKGDFANENTVTDKRRGEAVFGNVEWHFNDALSLIVGGRYSHDTHENIWDNVYSACGHQAVGEELVNTADRVCELRPDQVGNLTYDLDGNGETRQTGGRWEQLLGRYGKNSGNDFSYRVAMNWKPSDDFSAYASVAKGYKPAGARGAPDGGFANVSLYDKETLMNYEIGFNAYFMDRRARLSGAVFYMDWNDYQVEVREAFCRVGSELIPQEVYEQSNDPLTCEITPVDRTENAKKARSKGIELSGDFLITDNLKFGAAFGYLNAEFVEYVGSVLGTDQDLSGTKIGAAPSTTASANLQYDFEAFGGDTSARLVWSYRSEVSNARSRGLTDRFPTQVPSFHLLNASVSQAWDQHRLSLNVDNLFNEQYFTGSDNSMIGRALSYNPRRFMLRWTMEFDG